jgi:hypothetical protein
MEKGKIIRDIPKESEVREYVLRQLRAVSKEVETKRAT